MSSNSEQKKGVIDILAESLKRNQGNDDTDQEAINKSEHEKQVADYKALVDEREASISNQDRVDIIQHEANRLMYTFAALQKKAMADYETTEEADNILSELNALFESLDDSFLKGADHIIDNASNMIKYGRLDTEEEEAA